MKAGEPIGIVTERHPLDLVWKQSDGEEPHSTAPKLFKNPITNKKRNLYSKMEANSPKHKKETTFVDVEHPTDSIYLLMSCFAMHNICWNTFAIVAATTLEIERDIGERANRLQTTN